MGQEEGSISITCSVVALRRSLCKEGVVTEVEDFRNGPVKGKVTTRIGLERCNDNALNDKLYFMTCDADQLIVND